MGLVDCILLRGFVLDQSQIQLYVLSRSDDNIDRSVSSRSFSSSDPLLLPTSLKRENVLLAAEG